MPESRREFMKRVRRAAADPHLGEALRRSSETYDVQRATALAGLDFERMRAEVRAVKERAIGRLPELFEQFRVEAEALGATVTLAATAEEARQYVVGLAQERGVKLIVKSKSMATEEIFLNPALEAAGIEVLETDLGEWIVQLAGERPSHFVTPAFHKTREQVAELFSKHAGRELPPDIPTLVEYARTTLRQAYIDAGLGITGANLAIAESGTIVVCTNEGNARLVSSLPPVHVAVVGLEKLVPALEDTVPILKLLGRCATGQKLTTYTSFITGPSRTADIEKHLVLGAHGPKELHIVFLDNGREAMRQDPELREALYCIKCSSCLNTCPAFKVVAGHVFGETYHGGIGCVLTAGQQGLPAAERILELCAECKYCAQVCPSLVDTPRMVRVVKERLAATKPTPPAARAATWVTGNPARLGMLAKLGSIGQRLAGPLLGMAAGLGVPGGPALRSMPPLAARPLPAVWVKGTAAATVQLFPGCLVTHSLPGIGLAAARVLRAAGSEPALPAEAGCCGMPSLHLGDVEGARAIAAGMVKRLAGERPVITICPTCSAALRLEYPRLLAGTEWEEAAKELAARTQELVEHLAERGYQPPAVGEGRVVAYHESCHMSRSLAATGRTKALLAAAGYQLPEVAEADRCCGFAGTYAVQMEPVSEKVLARKMQCLAGVSPDLIATDCPGCLLHLERGAAEHGVKAPVRHTAELLAP